MPRTGQKATQSEHDEKPAIAPNDGTRPCRQQREWLSAPVLEELWSIWRADPRVPSVKSRRSWAISRNANSRLVDGWFSRRRICAKKAGQPMSNESYDLPLDPPIVPKCEPSPAPLEPDYESLFDLPSDDTLVLTYPSDDNGHNDVEASSDTVFEDAFVEPRRTETPAYKEVPQQSCMETFQGYQQEPTLSFPESVAVAEDRCDKHVSPDHPSLQVCGKEPNPACILCSTTPVQDDVLSDSDTASDSTARLFAPFPSLDFLPYSFPELSAIPFLFRTPRIVLPDDTDNHRTVDNWTIVEEELERLVNDGGLDFSFLDDPRLVALELLD